MGCGNRKLQKDSQKGLTNKLFLCPGAHCPMNGIDKYFNSCYNKTTERQREVIKMKNTKLVDIRVGENVFTVRCDRYEETSFGVIVSFSVYELHEHPTNFLKRFLEFWKYRQFASDNWVESLSDYGLQEYILDTCKGVVKSNEKHFNALKEWENL